MKKGIAVLGSTGSIGRQTLDVVSGFPQEFNVTGLSTKGKLDIFKEQVRRFSPKHVSILEDGTGSSSSPGYRTKIYRDADGLIRLAEDPDTDIIVMSIIGTAGLQAAITAIKKGKTLALASKEILVAAGDILMPLAKKYRVKILPLDSEHSAIFQCLQGQNKDHIKKIILTASGGPFRKFTRRQLRSVTAKQALAHPTWTMGPKITIDSATLMNKGLEVIEAHHLFGVPYENIEVVIHPQSMIHSMVEFIDGSVIAQIGVPDMRGPIQYALTYPNRQRGRHGSVDFLKMAPMTFERPDTRKFPCLDLAYKAGETGGTMPAVLSAANDIAVELFLGRRISFTDIPKIVAAVMKKHKPVKKPSLEQILSAEKWARQTAAE